MHTSFWYGIELSSNNLVLD